MKKYIYILFVILSTKCVSQEILFKNKEICAKFILNHNDSMVFLKINIVNKSFNDIYFFNFYDKTTLCYYDDMPNKLFIESGGRPRYVGDYFPKEIIKLRNNDTLYFEAMIFCSNFQLINTLSVFLPYLNPYRYNKKTTKRILGEIFQYPLSLSKNENMDVYTLRTIILWSKYGETIELNVPLLSR